ncbi:MAG: hypothetical protein QOJ12_1905 [Thermoleophilales bacterium]|jgi:hypothetical protein|nr:hypothetical protein [Thermoleophilales bacterium]
MVSHTERVQVTGWLKRCGEPRAEVAVALADLEQPTVMTTRADRVARLAMDARYHLERRELYRTKVDGPHAASVERMRDMEQEYELAAERLVIAEADGSPPQQPAAGTA